jgi:hypothetical protein|tara:strand:- start:1479 stop:1709 length:231 start_codon:yes stop_codon:yes gene_type:complete
MQYKPNLNGLSAPLKTQYGQGAYAFSRGWLTNQYDATTLLGKEWQRGFDAAFYHTQDGHVSPEYQKQMQDKLLQRR